MTVTNFPVIFVPKASFDIMLTGKDPSSELLSQMASNGNPPTSLPQWDPSQGGAAPPATFRTRAVVISTLDVAVENVLVSTPHGYQSGQPVVLGGNGRPTRKPSSDPVLSGANANTGDVSLDWIDAPPPTMASVGMWSFDQYDYFLVPLTGASYVLQLRVAGGPDVMLCGIVNALQGEQAWSGQICDSAHPAPDASTFYDDTDNTQPNPTLLAGAGVALTMRWVKTFSDGYFLLAFLETSS